MTYLFFGSANFEPSQYVTFLQESLNWGIQAGLKATAFIAGMSLLTYMFKE